MRDPWIVLLAVAAISLILLVVFMYSGKSKRCVRGSSVNASLFAAIPSVSGNPAATAAVAAAAATTASNAKRECCCEGESHDDARVGESCGDEKHECGCDQAKLDYARLVASKKTSSHLFSKRR